jgi:hypothetical protein
MIRAPEMVALTISALLGDVTPPQALLKLAQKGELLHDETQPPIKRKSKMHRQ